MPPPRRHQIAWLSGSGWFRVLGQEWDADARACLAHWAEHQLPLVVTRQPVSAAANRLSLGLSAPDRWQRRRFALCVEHREVLYFDEFPRASDVTRLLPADIRPAWRMLCESLASRGVSARVYGSYGWQQLTKLDHLHANSDIDLCIGVSDPDQADMVAGLLGDFAPAQPRLDGELVFDEGAAVTWREWAKWRSGRSAAVMVKRIDGVTLARAPFWGAMRMPLEMNR